MYESHFDPIPEETKQYLLKLSRDITPVFDTGDIGLVYLDKDEMMKIFGPYMIKHFKKEKKFTRAWTHWMKDGGSRPRHQHSSWTYLYYLDIPKGDSGTLVFDDGKLQPIEGTHVMFPRKTYHSITPNNTKKTRWAFAAEAVPI